MDGTFQGPDAVTELVAMHLHRLGAAQAQSLTFVADGGVWIWERIGAIVQLAKLADVPIYQVLDCYHATHHISLALAALGLPDSLRMPLYREHRTLLRNGQWRQVVDELLALAEDAAEDSQVWTEKVPAAEGTRRTNARGSTPNWGAAVSRLKPTETLRLCRPQHGSVTSTNGT